MKRRVIRYHVASCVCTIQVQCLGEKTQTAARTFCSFVDFLARELPEEIRPSSKAASFAMLTTTVVYFPPLSSVCVYDPPE